MKAESTIRKECKLAGESWRQATPGTARGWFLLGVVWGLRWARGRASRPTLFGVRSWPCDRHIDPTTAAMQAEAEGSKDE